MFSSLGNIATKAKKSARTHSKCVKKRHGHPRLVPGHAPHRRRAGRRVHPGRLRRAVPLRRRRDPVQPQRLRHTDVPQRQPGGVQRLHDGVEVPGESGDRRREGLLQEPAHRVQVLPLREKSTGKRV